MFIEVTSSGNKKMVNTDHIVAVGLFSWGQDESPVIVLDSPLTPRGTTKIITDESYEELTKLLK